MFPTHSEPRIYTSASSTPPKTSSIIFYNQSIALKLAPREIYTWQQQQRQYRHSRTMTLRQPPLSPLLPSSLRPQSEPHPQSHPLNFNSTTSITTTVMPSPRRKYHDFGSNDLIVSTGLHDSDEHSGYLYGIKNEEMGPPWTTISGVSL